MLFSCLAFTAEGRAEDAPPTAPTQFTTDSKLQTMVYEVYAGGVHVLQGSLVVDLREKGKYDVNLTANTRGVWKKLIPWSGTFESNGWVLKDATFRPKTHRSKTNWKDEWETQTYSYGRDESFKSLTKKKHDEPEELKDIDDALTQGTTDVLSSTLNVMNAIAQGQKCEGTSEVFDGKRRFQQLFRSQAGENLTATKYNIYEGLSEICTVEVVPIAGKWHEKPRGWMSIQEQGRAAGTIPTVWMAKITEGAPAVPVKVRVKTDYGTLFMHLAEYQNGENILVAAKRRNRK